MRHSAFTEVFEPTSAPTPTRHPLPLPLDGRITPGLLTFETAQDRWHKQMIGVNHKVGKETMGGRLVAKPLCPSACVPGEVADTLLELELNPFGQWNMLYYAPSPVTATMLKAPEFDPAHEYHFDDMMCRLIAQVRVDWINFRLNELRASAATIRDYRLILQRTITLRAARTEAVILKGNPNPLARYFSGGTCHRV